MQISPYLNEVFVYIFCYLCEKYKNIRLRSVEDEGKTQRSSWDINNEVADKLKGLIGPLSCNETWQ